MVTGTVDDGSAVVARLIYATNVSLDGCTEDANGGLDWGGPPGDEVFISTTGLMRSAGTYLYGRGMYEAMAVWETDPSLAAHSDLTAEFARTWQAADKVVYSSTLAEPSTAKTRVERRFDTDSVRALKAQSDRDLVIGGPNLAAQALAAGLIDEIVLYLWPVVLGGRKPALPTDVRVQLELVDEHRFASGIVRLHYRVQ